MSCCFEFLFKQREFFSARCACTVWGRGDLLMGRLIRETLIDGEMVGFAEGGCRLDGIEGIVALMVEGLGVESCLFFE
jgi:hypothetical protein